MEDKVVLIVDDSFAIRSQVKLLLDKAGFTVRDAGNGIGMFNLIEEYGKVANLIIMDISLKDENGFELIDKLKKNIFYTNIPIIMLTENAQLENVKKAKTLGIESFIRKPIDPEDLLKRVKSALKIS